MGLASLNFDNPLAKYKMKFPELDWVDISAHTGMPTVTLISVAKKSLPEIGKMYVETYFKIKDTLGIDLYEDFDKDISHVEICPITKKQPRKNASKKKAKS